MSESDIVKRLQKATLYAGHGELSDLPEEAADTITALRAKVERLEGALRNAYEVYAGSDGIIPETAAEGYQQQIIKQMVDCISAALGDTHE